MTDEEIRKRMAEIEGLQKRPTAYGFFWEHKDRPRDPVAMEWNPLTNWSDLGPLVEKYEVHIDPWFKKGQWHCCIFYGDDDLADCLRESLPHAICLAIIEANK